MANTTNSIKQMYWVDGKWVYVDAENANNLDFLDSTDFASKVTEKRVDHSNLHFLLSNNNWSSLLYSLSENATAAASYHTTEQGMAFLGCNKKYGVLLHMPIDPQAIYFIKAKVKRVTGDGNFSLGFNSLDNDYAPIGDSSFPISNQNFSGSNTFTFKVSGYNSASTTTATKFANNANYFDLVFMTGQNGTNQSTNFIIQSLEVLKIQDELYVGTYSVWHEGNFTPSLKADVSVMNTQLATKTPLTSFNTHTATIGGSTIGHVKNGGNITISNDGQLNTTPSAIGAYTKLEIDNIVDNDVLTHSNIIGQTTLGHVKNGGNVFIETDGRITTTPTSIGAYTKNETDNLIAIKLTDKVYVDAHIADAVKHITTAERTKWNAKAEANGSNAKDFTTKNLTVTGSILPSANSIYDIGSPTNRFRSIYVDEAHLSTNTLYIGSTPILGTEADTINIKADPDQSICMKTSSTGTTSIISEKAVSISTSGMNSNITFQTTGTNSQANIAATSAVNVNAPTIKLTGETVIDGNLTAKNLNISGNFTIGGTLTTVNTDNLVISDNLIDINKGEVGQGVSEGIAGIKIDRGDLNAMLMVFDETDDKFKIGDSTNLLALATEKYVYDNRYIHPAGTNPHGTTKADVGLGNVTNESKTTMFTSPSFTGTPVAPTAADNTNTTQVATTAFVMRESAKKANVEHGNHVPVLEAANVRRFLRNDNTWQALPIASVSGSGIVQLNNDVTSTLTTQAATINAVKIAYDLADSKATIDPVTTSSNGLMSKEDKAKLDTVAMNANNYIHPTTHPATMIVEDVTHRFVADTDKANWNGKSDSTYVDSTFVKLSGGSMTGKLTVPSLGIQIGEGLDFIGDNNYFGTNLDARIMRMIDSNGSNGNVDGGLVIQAHTPMDSVTVELLRIRNNEFAYKQNKIYHEGFKPNQSDVGLNNVDNTSDINKPVSTAMQNALNLKVDKVTGKQLSTEDYTTAEKTKLSGIATNANNYVHPSTHAATMIVEDTTHRFTTDAEKTSWSAKETPTGAQAKADSALSSAKSYTDTRVTNLIDAAPAALNTLNKLSNAINNDASFYLTMNTQLGLKADKTYTDTELAKKSNLHEHPYRPDTWVPTWTDVTNKPATFTPSSHNHPSSQVTVMTGYTKATTSSAIATTDSLNSAIGKLEKALDTKENVHTHPYAPDTHPNVIATATTLGHIKSGGDITVDTTGIVAVNDNSHNHTVSNVTNLQSLLDAKETPAGAQTKATTALTSANGYTDTKVADLIATSLGADANFATTINAKINTKADTTYVDAELAKKSDNHTHPYRLDTWVPSWSDVTSKPSTFAPSAHNQASSTITAMTSYVKATAVSAIAVTDSLNTAIGKLEKALDTKQGTHTHPYAPDTHPAVIATATVLGHIKSGGDITIDTSGIVSVNDDSHNHIIANVDGLQSVLDLKETIVGAQAKADTALSSSKSYTDTKLAALVTNDVSIKADKTYVDTELAKKSDNHTHPYRPDTWVPAWSDVTSKPSTFVPSAHTHKSSEVTLMTGYVKATATAAIAATDTLNSAIGKLEKALDTKEGTHTHPYAPDTHPSVVATSTALGHIKSGGDITIDASGVVAVNDDSHNHIISNVDGLQALLDLKETIVGAQSKVDSALTSSKAYTDTKLAALVSTAPETLDTLKELATALGNDPDFATTITNKIGLKSDKTYVDAELAKKSDVHTHPYRPDTWVPAWSDVTGKPSTFTPSTHNHKSSEVTAMTSYVKATTASAIATTDTLNVAIGKLEKALDTKEGTHAHPYAPDTHPSVIATATVLGHIKSGGAITINASGIVSVNDDSHNHIISNVDGLQAALDLKETIIGAQAKADTALTSAKSYTDTKLSDLVTNNVSIKADKTYVDEELSKKANNHTHPYKLDSWVPTWSDIASKPTTFTPATHNHPASQITLMTGYAKATAMSAIATTDSLNVAIGKLEKALDAKEGSHAHPYAPDTHPDVIATATVLGHIKSGGDITVDATGIVAVNDNSHNHTIANITSLQSTLDAKETPTGAQTKATAALTSAKSYTDTKITDLITNTLGNDASFATTITAKINTKADTTYVDAELAKKSDVHSHPYRPDTWVPAWTDVTGKPSTFAPSSHNQASNTITAMTGYTKATASAAIATTDSLNVAIGKLEKALDTKEATHAHPYAPDTHPAVVATATTLGHIKSGGGITVDATGAVTINNNSHTHTIANITSLQSTLDAKETPVGAQTKATAALTSAQTYTNTAINNLIGTASADLNTLGKIAASINNDATYYQTVNSALALKADKTYTDSTFSPIHSHPYLNLAGGTMTGNITFTDDQEGIVWTRNTDGAFIKFKNLSDGDTDSYLEFNTADNGNEYFKFTHRSSTGTNEWMSIKSDGVRVLGNLVYHAGNKPTLSDLGAAPTTTATTTTNGLLSSDDKAKLDKIGDIVTLTKTLTLTTDWQDVGITGADLETGSYMIQLSGMSTGTGFWYEVFTGTMSWYAGGTNSTDDDEILLHKAGHASTSKHIYLRTIRSVSSGYLKLQISCSASLVASPYTFKFRKLI